MQIFVSYAREDGELVGRLVGDLAVLNHAVWYDRELHGGQIWWDEILDRIRFCDLFLFALTPGSVSSAACRLELGYANELRRPLVPVMLRHVAVSSIPPGIAYAQYVDYRDTNPRAGVDLAAALGSAPSPPPLPDPLPAPPPMPVPPLVTLRALIDRPLPLTREDQLYVLNGLKQEAQDRTQQKEVYGLYWRFRSRDDVVDDVRVRADVETRRLGPFTSAFVAGMILLGPCTLGLAPLIVGLANLAKPARHRQAIILVAVGALLLIGTIILSAVSPEYTPDTSAFGWGEIRLSRSTEIGSGTPSELACPSELFEPW